MVSKLVEDNNYPDVTNDEKRGLSPFPTIGFGDRLGIATEGIIQAIKDYPITPVLAQQSIRELKFTDRTYEDVLNDVKNAVKNQRYTDFYGSDADHLKKREDIEVALYLGFTMITLDCSEYINNKEEHVGCDIPQKYIDKYIGKDFTINNQGKRYTFKYTLFDLNSILNTFGDALNFTIKIYRECIVKHTKSIHFELSIDEAIAPTSPKAHFLIAKELTDEKVNLYSIAPKFCGDFQKGIDYIGNTDQFEEDLKVHNTIAKHFGYKISIHSGSDKYSIFPAINRVTKGDFHLKTAGTHWLEGVRVISDKAPCLYRQIHNFALNKFDEALKYYQVKADTKNIPLLNKLTDDELPNLLDMPDSRQLLHITYGFIMQERDNWGNFLFRDKIYEVLNRYKEDYKKALKVNIQKHLSSLGISKKNV